jgi:cell division protein FtsB
VCARARGCVQANSQLQDEVAALKAQLAKLKPA